MLPFVSVLMQNLSYEGVVSIASIANAIELAVTYGQKCYMKRGVMES